MHDGGDSAMDAVSSFFEAAKRRDFAAMRGMLSAPAFTSFGGVPPYGMQASDAFMMHEEMRLAAISDYDYEISGARVFESGGMAVASFMLRQKGMLVDNKTFSGETVSSDARATAVLVRDGTWRIVHLHVSGVPR